MTAAPQCLELPSSYPRNLLRQAAAAQHWAQHRPSPSPVLDEAVRRLKRDGVLLLDWADLGLPMALFHELRTASFARCDDVLAGVPGTTWDTGEKSYWRRLLGDRQIASDSRDVFARVALSEPLIGIAGGYFGVSPWLMEYNLWLNSIEPGAPHASQLWHRDTEITEDGRFAPSFRSILKGFVYLHDVSPAHGPTTYIPGTQSGGWRAGVQLDADWIEPRGAIRYFDDTIAEAGLAQDAVQAIGPKGTVVLFDASGLHKGGKPLSEDRLLYKFELGDWLWRGFPYPKLRWAFSEDTMGSMSALQRFATGGDT